MKCNSCYKLILFSLFNTWQGLSVVQLFHKDVEGYLSAEGIYGESVQENGEIMYKIR